MTGWSVATVRSRFSAAASSGFIFAAVTARIRAMCQAIVPGVVSAEHGQSATVGRVSSLVWPSQRLTSARPRSHRAAEQHGQLGQSACFGRTYSGPNGSWKVPSS